MIGQQALICPSVRLEREILRRPTYGEIQFLCFWETDDE